ncbi:unnamed protein product, partial [Brachionus calyciflorus]
CFLLLTSFYWQNTDLNDWNHYDSYVKTNNRIEGLHSGLNKMEIKQRPNIFHLIGFLKVQQACTLADYARLKLGQDIRKKSKKKQEKEFSLELIKRQYENSSEESIATSVVTLRINETNSEDFVYTNLRTVELPDLVWNYQQEKINSYDENTEVEINVENTDRIYNMDDINADVLSVRSGVYDDDDEDGEESYKFDLVSF